MTIGGLNNALYLQPLASITMLCVLCLSFSRTLYTMTPCSLLLQMPGSAYRHARMAHARARKG